MTETQLAPVTIEGAQIVLRNFKGAEEKFNPPGTRTFGVLLPDEIAAAMLADGWNVKQFKVREEELAEDPEAQGNFWIQVTAEYRKGRPPRAFLIASSGKKTLLTDETISQLDGVDLQNVDVIINPYRWEANGNGGIKAYLKTMYVTIEEDELDRKYSDMETQ